MPAPASIPDDERWFAAFAAAADAGQSNLDAAARADAAVPSIAAKEPCSPCQHYRHLRWCEERDAQAKARCEFFEARIEDDYRNRDAYAIAHGSAE